ncbi:chromate resistance protein ChrB domain-containing protein [Roseobacter sinensis]|uniref:Chromate resistance protein n=1 Tax=Roseobacter sinensis TaxID=2931391 RepID=A0ABT3BEL2_9RHOB|nr:chromate resistance protein ChrB domain-containing protein [Roseobacter sp. WL0113]MCV3271993.1 chromate resistance protein [Roseobacter sp. WL0113]
MAQFATLTPQTLMRLIGTDHAPAIVDVALDGDVQKDPFIVPTARRWSHLKIDALLSDLKEKTFVIVCQKGRKLSHGVAALLRQRGADALVLEGGNFAWRAAGLPRVPLGQLPAPAGPGRWVTVTDPALESLACAWLIRRFIAPDAEFLFVPPAEVDDVAERFSAIPFGTTEGSAAAFSALSQRMGLDTDALRKMAGVLAPRAAPAEAAGIAALGTGLELSGAGDHARLAAAMTLCDALYLWARDGQTPELAA